MTKRGELFKEDISGLIRFWESRREGIEYLVRDLTIITLLDMTILALKKLELTLPSKD